MNPSIKEKLESKGYRVSIFENREDAVGYLKDSIKNTTVGIGGSQTANALDLRHELSDGNTIYTRDFPNPGDTKLSNTNKAATTDIYILSANAISDNGEIINIDGTGNRLASSLYGHSKVYYIVGENKIGGTLEEAIARARNTAGPKNALRLHRETPCAIKVRDELEKRFRDLYKTEEIDQQLWARFIADTDISELTRCYDCKVPDRVCRSILVHMTKPGSMEEEVVIVKEKLGY